jgi:hypothetical protein
MTLEMKQLAGFLADENVDLTHTAYSHKSIARGEAVGLVCCWEISLTGSSDFTGEGCVCRALHI